MAVKIRLRRMGAKKQPFYRLVVADSRSPRDGRFIEELGWYNPLPPTIKLRLMRIKPSPGYKRALSQLTQQDAFCGKQA